MKKIILNKIKYVGVLYLVLFSCIGAWAQSNITGKVTDENGAGLSGVTILLKGTATGTGTDANGNFSIAAPDGKGALVISSVGYTTQEVPVNNRGTVNVTLVSDIRSLENVVVVGYGS
ncbi:MAG: carboxypeptidase-like regulatory domain-containing protein, partial [Segetibacter sp.]